MPFAKAESCSPLLLQRDKGAKNRPQEQQHLPYVSVLGPGGALLPHGWKREEPSLLPASCSTRWPAAREPPEPLPLQESSHGRSFGCPTRADTTLQAASGRIVSWGSGVNTEIFLERRTRFKSSWNGGQDFSRPLKVPSGEGDFWALLWRGVCWSLTPLQTCPPV